MADYDVRNGLFDKFYRVLTWVQKDREFLPMEFAGTDVNPYWNTYEILVMQREVNSTRKTNNMPLVNYSDVRQLELQASGHVDYTKKFALYCAELAMGQTPKIY